MDGVHERDHLAGSGGEPAHQPVGTPEPPSSDPRRDWRYWVVPFWSLRALYRKDPVKFKRGLVMGCVVGFGGFPILVLLIVPLALL